MTRKSTGRLFAAACVLWLVGRNDPVWADRSKPDTGKSYAAPLVLSDVEGVKVQPLMVKSGKATVFIFIAHDCPIANGYAPEVNSLYAEYGVRGVGFSVVYVEDDLPIAEAKRHARAHQFTCRALRDPKHLLVRRLSATVTPEAVVVTPNGRTVYQGRIDDRVQDFGKMHPQPTVSDLRNALDAVLAGKPVPQPRTKAIGCFIPHVP